MMNIQKQNAVPFTGVPAAFKKDRTGLYCGIGFATGFSLTTLYALHKNGADKMVKSAVEKSNRKDIKNPKLYTVENALINIAALFAAFAGGGAIFDAIANSIRQKRLAKL